MRKLNVENINKIKKTVPLIENKIKINISFNKNSVSLKGNELNEFLTQKIIRAVDFGFDVRDALLLANEDFVLEFVEVKEHTRRKNLRDVRARLIGTEGKAKRTIQNLTGSVIVISGNRVGLIVDSFHLDSSVQAIESLIHGAKHSNVFSYLEKQNINRQNIGRNDLGLKSGFKENDAQDN
jgi:ribosomal RNA assembly protein